MNRKEITIIENKIKKGYNISSSEALELANIEDRELLYNLANNLRIHFNGNTFESCSIINAKSGRCPEDCKWCSQSAFYKTKIDSYPLIPAKSAVEMATHNTNKGVERFSLVASGKRLSDTDTLKAAEIYEKLRKDVDIKLCASLGLMTKSQLQTLFNSGVTRYHCNIESAPSHFSELCTTHTINDKIATLKAAKEVGMQTCSGGIIGMGESLEQRIEFAMVLRDIAPDSIPINILSPIPNTPLEDTPPLTEKEILTAIAIIKVVNPTISLRFAGGRGALSFTGQQKALNCGISGAIVGDLLTTAGATNIETDMNMAKNNGFNIEFSK